MQQLILIEIVKKRKKITNKKMQQNTVKTFDKNQIKQLLDNILPVFMQAELKNNKKPVTIANILSYEKINQYILKKFPSADQNLITQEKLDKIYEGIIEILKSETETAMVFKNVIDIEFVKMYFLPYDLKEAHLIQTKNQINIIILIFQKQ
ncbi:hypothetical protein TTHERM_000852919 (macronuclear) [Tetrahymena thermophila SB210]|uniref:Uncharacterized protein n=1 Tax=Tetrahymena thermophila (strain SB210) TaxID=312017 RepID=W7WX41_TETTS|nr:hypothetical protein TTHERM_000852919 [Tetrahymena thermophila SB210]EWS71370.1 hypothetical protein TTHERM_000852919 [Tetrahymena thermophila SB210]|eukprot:XP_012656103.1 hypothetical protein TTHERM_000852919 [Tetrahymena thermophila SB210]